MTSAKLLFGILALAGLAAAQDSISIKVDGVGTCAAQAWGFDATNPVSTTTGSAGGTARAQITPVMVTKSVDGCSTGLLKHLAAGTDISEVTLTQTDPTGKQPVFTLVMTSVFVTDYRLSGVSSNPSPSELVSFSFGKIVVTSGSTMVTWNLRTQTAN
jgi:type VI protein secretion system component Hcp